MELNAPLDFCHLQLLQHSILIASALARDVEKIKMIKLIQCENKLTRISTEIVAENILLEWLFLEQKFSGAIQCWSTKQPVTYFGLLLPELLKESQIFIVFSSCLTQVSHYLWCLGYARLDGFVPALMGLNQLLKIMEYR